MAKPPSDTVGGQAAPARDDRLTPHEQDFVAALHELDSNLRVRRLMVVLSNILIPALGVAAFDALTGQDYPPPLRWLPEHILPLTGVVLTLAGILTTAILTRCHYGMVLNGNKMDYVLDGDLRLYPLNWLGVTANFVALTALYAGAGWALLLLALGFSRLALPAGALLAVAAMLFLTWNHRRANRQSQRHVGDWQTGRVAHRHRERHARLSLEATTEDVSVIVLMAAALFAGMYACMNKLGSLNATLQLTPDATAIKAWGLPLLAGFTLLSLLLSGRMVVRLRIALADHAERLAKLRDERDDPWRFRPLERTYLLYLLVHLLSCCAMLILVWSLSDRLPALAATALLLLVGLLWYPYRLQTGRRSTQRLWLHQRH